MINKQFPGITTVFIVKDVTTMVIMFSTAWKMRRTVNPVGYCERSGRREVILVVISPRYSGSVIQIESSY